MKNEPNYCSECDGYGWRFQKPCKYCNNTGRDLKGKRLEIANKMIKIISDHGRRFFYSPKNKCIAYFKIKNGRIYFVDEYSLKEIYLHYKCWHKGFTNGGTLRCLIENLKEYIIGRKEFPLYQVEFGGEYWGYSDEEMNIVIVKCKKLV